MSPQRRNTTGCAPQGAADPTAGVPTLGSPESRSGGAPLSGKRHPSASRPPQDVATLVAEFHAALGQQFGDGGSGNESRADRAREEHEELVEALRGGDRVEIAQELADVVYEAYGAAYSLGIPLDAVIAEVHRANMTKAGPDGRFVLNEHGKVIKPPGFTPANVAAVIDVAVTEEGKAS